MADLCKMKDFEVEKNILMQFINKTWCKLEKMNKILIKRIVLYCPTSSHNSSTFYSHIHTYTYTYTKLTHWLPRHTTRRLLSTNLRATSEGSMTKWDLPLLTSPCWKGGTMVHCLKQAPCGKFWAWRLSDPAACKPRDRTARPVLRR